MILLMALSIIPGLVARKRSIQPADIAPPLLSYTLVACKI